MNRTLERSAGAGFLLLLLSAPGAFAQGEKSSPVQELRVQKVDDFLYFRLRLGSPPEMLRDGNWIDRGWWRPSSSR